MIMSPFCPSPGVKTRSARVLDDQGVATPSGRIPPQASFRHDRENRLARERILFDRIEVRILFLDGLLQGLVEPVHGGGNLHALLVFLKN